MIKNSLLQPIAVMALVLSISAFLVPSHAAGATEEQNSSSPFLIVGKLPHLTKLLMQHWDSPELNLTEEQKEKLLVVRKETMAAVQQLSPEVASLEKQVVEGIQSDKTPKELQPFVQNLANLKAKATMVHLRCIHDTQQVLDKQQLQLLGNPK